VQFLPALTAFADPEAAFFGSEFYVHRWIILFASSFIHRLPAAARDVLSRIVHDAHGLAVASLSPLTDVVFAIMSVAI